jgi:hypothetical protein
MEKTSKKERVTGRVNVLSERERNNFCLPLKVTDTHRHRERERRRENKREMMFTASRNTTTKVSLCPQRHNGQHKKQSRKHQRTTNKKRTQTMSIKAMAKKGGKSGSNNDAPEGFGFPKRCDSIPSSSSVTSSRR